MVSRIYSILYVLSLSYLTIHSLEIILQHLLDGFDKYKIQSEQYQRGQCATV